MRSRYILLALGALSSVALAQVSRSPVHYQKISEVAGGWTWYINKSSVRPAGDRMVQFWLTGDNAGAGTVRRTMIQVKLACDQALHIPLHTTNFGTSGVISDMLKGDSSENWTRVLATSPVAAARPWVC